MIYHYPYYFLSLLLICGTVMGIVGVIAAVREGRHRRFKSVHYEADRCFRRVLAEERHDRKRAECEREEDRAEWNKERRKLEKAETTLRAIADLDIGVRMPNDEERIHGKWCDGPCGDIARAYFKERGQ